MEGSRKRRRPHLRRSDSIKEAVGISLQELSRAIEDKTLWMSLIIESPGIGANSMARNILKGSGKYQVIHSMGVG